jgi:hypothetical protein
VKTVQVKTAVGAYVKELFSSCSAEDLKTQLTMWFSNCEVSPANYAAHELAKLGKSCMPNHVMYWENECTAEIAGFVSGDLALMVD